MTSVSIGHGLPLPKFREYAGKKTFGKLYIHDRDRAAERYQCVWQFNGRKADVLDGYCSRNSSAAAL